MIDYLHVSQQLQTFFDPNGDDDLRKQFSNHQAAQREHLLLQARWNYNLPMRPEATFLISQMLAWQYGHGVCVYGATWEQKFRFIFFWIL